MTASPTRTAALALYTPPFRYGHGYIFDANGHVVAALSVMQDEVGALIAEILTAHWGCAPASPVPQGWKDVAELCAQMCESRASSLVKCGQLTAANEARKCASVLRNPPDGWREQLDAAAPQPPEAAPVQLPEPVAYRMHDPEEPDIGHWLHEGRGMACLVHEPLYTEQQVRELLAAHGIGAPS